MPLIREFRALGSNIKVINIVIIINLIVIILRIRVIKNKIKRLVLYYNISINRSHVIDRARG